MTFQAVVPFGGIGGWAFLERTREQQEAAFAQSASIVRDTDYFRETISSITTAEDLVADRRLLRVALGAFGLEEDIDAKAFIGKVLGEGMLNPDSLANRLSDKRYAAMSEAFGFDLSPPNTKVSSFPTEIIEAFRTRQFEASVGTSQPDMRLALGLDRDLTGLLERDLSDEANWFTIMATPPLRTVFERALGIPTVVGALDLDRQLEIFREKAVAIFGDSRVAQFSDDGKRADLRDNFLRQSELQSGIAPTVKGSAALAILQGSVGVGGLLP